jgi:hypothetical protein
MNRRFELGPILVALGALLLIVSLFLDWYGTLSAWEAFEVVDVLLAALAVTSLVGALGSLLPEVGYVERRWLPGMVLAVAVLVAAEIINPPPAAATLSVATGAWIGFAAAIGMLVGAVLSLGRVSLAVTVDGRDLRQRVAAVDERQTTTESGAVVVPPADGGGEPTASTIAQPVTPPAADAPAPADPDAPTAAGRERSRRRRP